MPEMTDAEKLAELGIVPLGVDEDDFVFRHPANPSKPVRCQGMYFHDILWLARGDLAALAKVFPQAGANGNPRPDRFNMQAATACLMRACFEAGSFQDGDTSDA